MKMNELPLEFRTGMDLTYMVLRKEAKHKGCVYSTRFHSYKVQKRAELMMLSVVSAVVVLVEKAKFWEHKADCRRTGNVLVYLDGAP